MPLRSVQQYPPGASRSQFKQVPGNQNLQLESEYGHDQKVYTLIVDENSWNPNLEFLRPSLVALVSLRGDLAVEGDYTPADDYKVITDVAHPEIICDHKYCIRPWTHVMRVGLAVFELPAATGADKQDLLDNAPAIRTALNDVLLDFLKSLPENVAVDMDNVSPDLKPRGWSNRRRMWMQMRGLLGTAKLTLAEESTLALVSNASDVAKATQVYYEVLYEAPRMMFPEMDAADLQWGQLQGQLNFAFERGLFSGLMQSLVTEAVTECVRTGAINIDGLYWSVGGTVEWVNTTFKLYPQKFYERMYG